jgi:hypothetical protein
MLPQVKARLHIKDSLIWGMWAALLFFLPVTSLPLLQLWISGWSVNPASAIPLAVLVPLALIPYLTRRGRLPLETIPLLGFLTTAAVATLLVFFRSVLPWKGQSVLSRSFSAWLTLGTGISFYLVTMTLVDTQDKLIKTLKMIYAGAIMMLFWSLAQAVVIYLKGGDYPRIMHVVHDLLSVRELFSFKVTGLAFESSWLAHQLNILYFPLWFGAAAQMHSFIRFRFGKITIEGILLAVGIVVLLLAKSRIGIASFLAMAALLILRFAFAFSRKISQELEDRFLRTPIWQNWLMKLITRIILLTFGLTLFALLVRFSFLIASKLDARLDRLFTADWPTIFPFNLKTFIAQIRAIFNVYFASYLMFAERTVYWVAAYRIFAAYPFFGVGLGNAGFFFPQTMPAFGWALPEVVEVMRNSTFIFPNPKHLWLRLLSETGVVGFTFFVVWLLVLLMRAWQLLRLNNKHYRALGLAGVLGMATIFVEGFSLDTFGLPYMWVILGLVSATARISRTKTLASPS